MDRRLDAKPALRRHRSLSSLSPLHQPRVLELSCFRPPPYSFAMNPLANEWTIKHRSDACALTSRPFVAGEHFYTLLFQDAEGFRREDLSEEAWTNRKENIQPFSFWKTRYEPAPSRPAETLGKESAEQIFRRLLSSENAPRSEERRVGKECRSRWSP